MKLRAVTLILTVTVFAGLMQACSRPLDPQEGCGFVQSPELQRVSWAGHTPVKIYYHNSIPESAIPAIDRAVDEYNVRIGGGKEIFRRMGRQDGDRDPKKDGYSVIYWFDTWEADRKTEQARTTIYWSGSEIFEGDVRINAKNFTYNYEEKANFSEVDLTSLMVHELGHVLGLAHIVTPGSVMNLTLDEGVSRRKLTGSDIASLKCEY